MKKPLWLIASFVWAIVIYRLTTTPNLAVSEEHLLNIILTNGAHFFFFGIQAVLLKLSMPISSHRMTIILPIITTSIFGYYIELLQRSIPGRSYDLMDWVLDTLGAITLIVIIKRYVEHKNSKSRY